MLVEIFVGEVALLFGEANEFPDFFLNQLRNVGRKGLNGSLRSARFALGLGFGRRRGRRGYRGFGWRFRWCLGWSLSWCFRGSFDWSLSWNL
jgi:hypothetical protein